MSGRCFSGYNRRLVGDEVFNLPEHGHEGFVCCLSEVDEKLKTFLLSNHGIVCSSGDWLLQGEFSANDDMRVYKAFDDASAASSELLDCKHLYFQPVVGYGCECCNCGCDSVH